MSTNGTTTVQDTTTTDTVPTVATDGSGAAATPEQLSLLATSGVPLQFRLDERTRRSGLAHVAALRAQIAAQAAARNLSPAARLTSGPTEASRHDSDDRDTGHRDTGHRDTGHREVGRREMGRQGSGRRIAA